MKEIGRKIKQRRQDLKMSQSELAFKVGVSYVTIYNVERGRNVSIETVIDICKTLELELIVK